MTSYNVEKFKEQCARKIIYRSECPDLMKIQCIKEKFDGDKASYQHWSSIMKQEEKMLNKILQKQKKEV